MSTIFRCHKLLFSYSRALNAKQKQLKYWNHEITPRQIQKIQNNLSITLQYYIHITESIIGQLNITDEYRDCVNSIGKDINLNMKNPELVNKMDKTEQEYDKQRKQIDDSELDDTLNSTQLDDTLNTTELDDTLNTTELDSTASKSKPKKRSKNKNTNKNKRKKIRHQDFGGPM